MKVNDVLRTGKNWYCQSKPKTYGNDHCLVTAMVKCYPNYDKRKEIYKRVLEYLDLQPPFGEEERFIMSWNDNQKSFRSVKKLIKDLDI